MFLHTSLELWFLCYVLKQQTPTESIREHGGWVTTGYTQLQGYGVGAALSQNIRTAVLQFGSTAQWPTIVCFTLQMLKHLKTKSVTCLCKFDAGVLGLPALKT
jgi:hypothetical protein